MSDLSAYLKYLEENLVYIIYVYYCKDIQWSLKSFSEYDVQERICWIQELNDDLYIAYFRYDSTILDKTY